MPRSTIYYCSRVFYLYSIWLKQMHERYWPRRGTVNRCSIFVRCCQFGALCNLVDEIHKDYNRTIEGDGKKVHRRHYPTHRNYSPWKGYKLYQTYCSTGFSSSFEIICHMEFTIIQHLSHSKYATLQKFVPRFECSRPHFRSSMSACVRLVPVGQPHCFDFRLES